MAAGWADQVARRVHSLERVEAAASSRSGGSSVGRAVRYQPAAAAADGGEGPSVFLHPRSALSRRAPPWCAFSDLVATAKRTYMTGVTSLDPAWLAACAPGMVAVEGAGGPSPRPASSSDLAEALSAAAYDRRRDAVMRSRAATFGPRRWPLPASRAAEPNAEARAAVFAEALLSGRALRSLAPLGPWLAAPPSSLRSGRGSGQRRVAAILEALLREGVDSVGSLSAAWSEQRGGGAGPLFLESEILSPPSSSGGGWIRAGGEAVAASALAAARVEAASWSPPLSKGDGGGGGEEKKKEKSASTTTKKRKSI